MLISVLICIYYIILSHSRWEFSLCFQIIPDGVFFPNSSFRLYASLKEIASATYGDKFFFLNPRIFYCGKIFAVLISLSVQFSGVITS